MSTKPDQQPAITALRIGADEFRALVSPVLPMAGKDEMLPVLCAVLIESNGKWLSAMTTDRYRVGIKRIEKHPTDDDPTTEWPAFRALVPVRAVKSIMTNFKPSRRTSPPAITLTVEDAKLTAEAVGLFDLFDSARFTHHLETGEFPGLRKVFRQALETSTVGAGETTVGVDPAQMADFKACGAKTLRVVIGAPGKPLLVTDDDGFIGLLQPRSLHGDNADSLEDWTHFFAEKPEPSDAPAQKVGAA